MLQCGQFNFKGKIMFLLKLPLEILGKISPSFGCKYGSESNLFFLYFWKSQITTCHSSKAAVGPYCALSIRRPILCWREFCDKILTTREPQNMCKWFRVKRGSGVLKVHWFGERGCLGHYRKLMI